MKQVKSPMSIYFQEFFSEFEQAFYQMAYNTMMKAIEDARQDAGLDQPFLNKKDTAARLRMSTDYLDRLIENGLPVALMDNKPMIHKQKSEQWIIDNFQN